MGEDGITVEATGKLWLCGTCSSVLDAFLSTEGTIGKKSVPVPVEVDRVPDYSCNPCRAGEHERCRPRIYLPDWQHDCTCNKTTPHFRLATVLVTVLD